MQFMVLFELCIARRALFMLEVRKFFFFTLLLRRKGIGFCIMFCFCAFTFVLVLWFPFSLFAFCWRCLSCLSCFLTWHVITVVDMAPLVFYLQQLHWLSVSKRIKHKTHCMSYNAITGSAPSYLSELLHLYSSSRSLRSSSDTRMPKLQRFSHKTHGFHTFSPFGPRIWNNLP